MTNYTIFTTYLLSGSTTSGYSTAIHCNYFNTLLLDAENLAMQEVTMNFSNPDDFKFLSSDMNTGFTAYKIYALIQTGVTTTTLKPDSANWKMVDITPAGASQPLTVADLTTAALKIPLAGNHATYDLSYLNYPTKEPTDDDKLCFGDEEYFLGNVTTDIHADVYTANLSVNLPLNEFNSTTNPTWDNESKIAITEIGIYDINKNLVAIGKLNDPIEKDSSIARTILFEIDF